MEDEDEKAPITMSTLLTTIITIIFLLSPSAAATTATTDDAVVMFKLSRSLNPPPPSWSGSNPCKWQGVSCDSSGRVISITLASKSISGSLPPELNQLSSLQILSVQNNRISGTIPAISNMAELREVFLNDNLLSSFSSPFLVGLPNLQTFSIDDNPLDSWLIPDGLSNSSSLQEFHAGNCSVEGPIPDIFGSLASLTELRLSYNNLTGPLPGSFAGSGIQNLWINNQKQGLSGTLQVLGDMPSLAQVWVHGNSFVGPIPDLSKCTSLFDLQLRDNHLTGVVPPSLTMLPKLVNISLQNNMFQGPMPGFGKGVQVTLGTTNSFCSSTPGPCDPQVSALLDIAGNLGYPQQLAASWKGNDACQNWVHVTCDSNRKVTVVNFAKQNWSGFISPSFANLTSLTSIILDDNDLVGTIPNDLTGLKMLQKLDVSNNNLTGKVPGFAKTVTVITSGNPFLGTDVDTSSSIMSPSGVSNSPSGTKSSTSSSNYGGLTSQAIIGIVVGVLVLLIAVGFLLYTLAKKRKANNKYGHVKTSNKGKSKIQDLKMSPILPGGSPTEQSSMINNVHTFYDHGNVIAIEILREVTDNFSEKNILGRGGFGIVYKGVLHDGTPIAVKRMESNLQGTKGLNEFEAEIAVLSKVRHRHLVALLGYCVNGSERIVVYEYMPQGTLGQHLFECREMGLSPLTWKQRLVIALDVARGVEYLHSLAQQSFIHRDLKPSNILLGEDMRAKVSDFGLVKNAPDQGKYSVETRLAGTFGYLAPEYAATGRVTTKVDVFAFGVVLMEIITARKALDGSLPEDEAQLVTWFRRVLVAKDNIRKALDPHLEAHDEEIFDSICKVAELSGHCTVREPQQRPDMSHAVNILSPLVEQWRPTDQSDGDDGGGMDMSLPQAVQRWQTGDTTMMSDYSTSISPTTPGVNESFTHVQGR